MAVKKRKRGPSLDEKYLGPEPIFTPESEFTSSAWTKAAHWYNYFYKSKDYMPTTYQFATDYCGFNKKKLSILKRLPAWRFMKVNKPIKLLYRGWQYDEEYINEIKSFIDEMYKLGLKEKKVEEQIKVVKEAEEAVEMARKDMIKKQHDVEKMKTHRKEWEKEMRALEVHQEGIETDELGTSMHTSKKHKQ